VVQSVARKVFPLIQVGKFGFQNAHIFELGGICASVKKSSSELLPRAGVDIPNSTIGLNTLSQLIAKLSIALVSPSNPDNGIRSRQILIMPKGIERREKLSSREIAGGAEYDQGNGIMDSEAGR